MAMFFASRENLKKLRKFSKYAKFVRRALCIAHSTHPAPMVLDINLLREDRGGNPGLVRESQQRRFASVDLVTEVQEADQAARKGMFQIFTISHYHTLSTMICPFSLEQQPNMHGK